MGPGRERYGWYFWPHIPYWDRVRSTSALPKVPVVQATPPADTTGVPLVIGTFNINGVQHIQTNLRLLLQQTQCDVMALQETQLRATDWQLCVPGYHCFTAMGDLPALQQGVAILISTKFTCTPVGKSPPFWTFVQVFGSTLLTPLIVGSIYVPCCVDRKQVLRALPRALAGLHREFPEDPIVMMGDFNMQMRDLHCVSNHSGSYQSKGEQPHNDPTRGGSQRLPLTSSLFVVARQQLSPQLEYLILGTFWIIFR